MRDSETEQWRETQTEGCELRVRLSEGEPRRRLKQNVYIGVLSISNLWFIHLS